MQTLPLCMCSFLEAKASFLNTTSQATTKESSTSNTSILCSPSKQDKKGADLLKNPNRINQILCLGKGRKLLKLHTSCFLCFREMWKGYQVNQTICIFSRWEQWSWPRLQTFVQKIFTENHTLSATGVMTVAGCFHSWVSLRR